MTNANWAKVAMKRKMMSGFENVTRNAVMPLWVSDPLFFCPSRPIDFMGFDRQQ